MAFSPKLLQMGASGAGSANYIEEVFSTFLYDGNSSTQTITNSIDLSTKGGLVWIKQRSAPSTAHSLTDTARGAGKQLFSNNTNAEDVDATVVSAFTSTGFSLGSYANTNASTENYVSWTFREQPKFFDIVTYTGNGVDGRAISHNLGSAPGCIIVKRTDSTSNWNVYHRQAGGSGAAAFWGRLNTTDADTDLENVGSSGTPTTTFLVYDASLGLDSCNINGATYVAYLFAHNAGGFGLTGTDNVISCGSFTAGTGSVNLGYEPQWIMFKGITGSNEWIMFDTMRGWPTEQPNKLLMAQSTAAEGDTYVECQPTATGFNYNFSPSCIYIAIRKGPMKVPTVGTSVFATALGVATTPNMVAGFPVDSFLGGDTNTPTATNWKWWDRLRRNVASLLTTTTAAEATDEYDYGQFQSMTGFISGNYDASDKIGWMFRRAPSFFDEVCYTGTGSARTVTHNLAAVPELIIFKRRSAANPWMVYCNRYNGGVNANQYYQVLNATDTVNSGSGLLNNTDPTSSVFTVGTWNENNASGSTYVAYLFATCAGVSKVGSYTGTATTLQVNCGFTTGARFVLIKRTDSTGDWYVWDSARGIIAGNDPYLLINSTAAEVTNTDYIDSYSPGFELSSTAPAALNANGGTYIFLAIA